MVASMQQWQVKGNQSAAPGKGHWLLDQHEVLFMIIIRM
jgi:hypothetical protein